MSVCMSVCLPYICVIAQSGKRQITLMSRWLRHVNHVVMNYVPSASRHVNYVLTCYVPLKSQKVHQCRRHVILRKSRWRQVSSIYWTQAPRFRGCHCQIEYVSSGSPIADIRTRLRDDSLLGISEKITQWERAPSRGAILASYRWNSRLRDDLLFGISEMITPWERGPSRGSICVSNRWNSCLRHDLLLGTSCRWNLRLRNDLLLGSSERITQWGSGPL